MTVATASVPLGEIDLFGGLGPEELLAVNRMLRVRKFAAGTAIMAEEEPGNLVYIVLRGSLRIHLEGAEGAEVTLAILGPGETVGEMSLVDSLTRSATVITREPTVVAYLDRTSFWELMRSLPKLTYNLASILSRRLRLANATIESLATLDVQGRVARQLLAFAQEYGVRADNDSLTIPLRLTQSDLAGLVGASRVRVNQVLVSYKRRKYISVDRQRSITVHNAPALAERCR